MPAMSGIIERVVRASIRYLPAARAVFRLEEGNSETQKGLNRALWRLFRVLFTAGDMRQSGPEKIRQSIRL
jgi:hypothetical protein